MNIPLRKIVLLFSFCFLLLTMNAYSENQQKLYNITSSDSHRYVWFRVAKVGTRSILKVLTNHTQLDQDGYHLSFDAAKYKDYFKFAFVRNPWDRVVSCYFNKVVTKFHPPFAECFDKDFNYFVNYIARQDLTKADIHIRLQTCLIPLKEVDFIGKLENMENDFQYVLNTIGLNDIAIPHENVSGHDHYSTYYNKKTKAIIAEKYKQDIQTFGYNFETIKK